MRLRPPISPFCPYRRSRRNLVAARSFAMGSAKRTLPRRIRKKRGVAYFSLPHDEASSTNETIPIPVSHYVFCVRAIVHPRSGSCCSSRHVLFQHFWVNGKVFVDFIVGRASVKEITRPLVSLMFDVQLFPCILRAVHPRPSVARLSCCCRTGSGRRRQPSSPAPLRIPLPSRLGAWASSRLRTAARSP